MNTNSWSKNIKTEVHGPGPQMFRPHNPGLSQQSLAKEALLLLGKGVCSSSHYVFPELSFKMHEWDRDLLPVDNLCYTWQSATQM